MKSNVHVKFRALEPEDLDMLYEIENDTELWDLGVTNVPYSRFLLHDYVAQSRSDIYVDGQVRLAIVGEEGEVVGLADLMNFDPKHRKAELGFVIRKEYRRRGYAKATLLQMLDYGLHTLHLHQLYAIVALSNTATVNLFQAFGYQPVSRLKEWLYDGKDYHDAYFFQCFL
jgi:diamine N-acetyltransferase